VLTPRMNGAAMANCFLCIIMTGMFLAAGAQAQETAPAATPPSIADAARAARERRESMTPKRIMTDDDIAAKRGAGDSANVGASEQQVRADMEKHYPPSLTKADLTQQIAQIKSIAARGDADMLVGVKRSALAGYESVEFPGKKRWEQDVSVAVTRMVEEANKGTTRLQAIVDGNQNVLAGRDLAASARLREMWIDELLPYATWQQRMRDLAEDGKARAKAYATGNLAGAAEYRHEAVTRNENAVGGMLSSMHIVEDELRNVQGHYACEAAQWPRDPRHPEIPNAMWTIYMNTASGAGYRLDIQGCDARHYSAVAIPPASDGSQGRAFCMDESGVVRVAPDGNPATCISRGSEWLGR
jgi:hypothetical protein